MGTRTPEGAAGRCQGSSLPVGHLSSLGGGTALKLGLMGFRLLLMVVSRSSSRLLIDCISCFRSLDSIAISPCKVLTLSLIWPS